MNFPSSYGQSPDNGEGQWLGDRKMDGFDLYHVFIVHVMQLKAVQIQSTD